MSDATATVMGATIAAVFGTLGAWLTVATQRSLENARWQRERQASRSAALVDAVRQLATVIAAALHSMAWMTWAARYSPKTFKRENVSNYDAEMHRLLPQLFGNLAAVITIDSRVYEELRAVVDDVVSLDARLGQTFAAEDSSLAVEVAAFHQEATRFEHDLPLRIGSAIESFFRG